MKVTSPITNRTADTVLSRGKSASFDHETVFEVDDYLYFYAESLTPERTDAEVEAIVRLLGLKGPCDILDLACGYGRHTNRLAALGHRMTGVDIMPGFLELARKDAAQRGVIVNYTQEDMRNIIFQDEYDFVLLLFTAFGYFDDEQNLQVLKNIYQALKPGGCVLLDTLNRDVILKNMHSFSVTEIEGNLMIDRNHFDLEESRLINRRIVIRDGIRRDKPFSIRVYNRSEIQYWFERAGLTILHIYGGWDTQPLSPEARRMIIIGQKPNR